MKRRLIALLSLVVLALSSSSVSAQTKGVGLSPALQEVELAADEASVTFVVNISNSSEATADLQLSTLDFGALDESGGIAFLGRTGQETGVYGLKQWMVLEKDRLTLEPGQSQEVKVTVENKESLGPGGHYGAVIVSAAAGQGAGSNDVAVLPATGTLVLLKKSGGDKPELQLNSIKANKSWLNLPKSATLRFQNSGNIHLVPRGTVELYGPTGTRLARSVINADSGFVLPASYRQFTNNLDFDKQPWLPGRYRLETKWRYDGQETFNQTVEYHWYMGKLLMWTLIIICIVFVLIMYIRYRKRPVSRGR